MSTRRGSMPSRARVSSGSERIRCGRGNSACCCVACPVAGSATLREIAEHLGISKHIARMKAEGLVAQGRARSQARRLRELRPACNRAPAACRARPIRQPRASAAGSRGPCQAGLRDQTGHPPPSWKTGAALVGGLRAGVHGPRSVRRAVRPGRPTRAPRGDPRRHRRGRSQYGREGQPPRVHTD
jgi:hypothetical protein